MQDKRRKTVAKFRPLHDRVLVLPDGAAPKTVGLAAPPSQKEEPTQGTVVAVGKDVPFAGADVVAPGVRVQWPKYAGREVEHDGRKHRLLRLEEIDGVLEEE